MPAVSVVEPTHRQDDDEEEGSLAAAVAAVVEADMARKAELVEAYGYAAVLRFQLSPCSSSLDFALSCVWMMSVVFRLRRDLALSPLSRRATPPRIYDEKDNLFRDEWKKASRLVSRVSTRTGSRGGATHMHMHALSRAGAGVRQQQVPPRTAPAGAQRGSVSRTHTSMRGKGTGTGTGTSSSSGATTAFGHSFEWDPTTSDYVLAPMEVANSSSTALRSPRHAPFLFPLHTSLNVNSLGVPLFTV